ncbi:MAG: tetratricopeptide repeat protein [Desulfobacterales bacterium]|nr:tetratricopeptide repeat protein [Desulfobacterales bacterium]
MAKKKRIKRKELLKEPDEFLTASSKALAFLDAHKNQAIWTLVGFMALIVIIAGAQYYSFQSQKKAFVLLSKSMESYQVEMGTKEPAEALTAVKADFDKLLDAYGGKDAGKIGRVLFADMNYQAGEYDKAIELYERAQGDFREKPLVKQQIIRGLAFAYQAKKNYESAVKYFEMIVSDPDGVMKDEALFNLGQLYATLNQPEKSKQSFQKLLTDHEDSMYRSIVEEKIAG